MVLSGLRPGPWTLTFRSHQKLLKVRKYFTLQSSHHIELLSSTHVMRTNLLTSSLCAGKSFAFTARSATSSPSRAMIRTLIPVFN